MSGVNGYKVDSRLLKLFLFGTPRLEIDGQAIDLNLRKAWALLSYVALNKQTHSRDTLATMFWAENDQKTARANLRRTLYRLHQATDIEVLTATAETIELNPNLDLWVDVSAYQILINTDDSDKIEKFELAVQYYVDDFLSGFSLLDSPIFDEWQFFKHEEFQQSLTHTLNFLVDEHSKNQYWDQSIPFARRLVTLDPLNESTHRHLMELYAWTDQKAAALRQYQTCERLLADELGDAPDNATQALYASIRTGQFAKPPSYERPPIQYVQNGEVYIAYQVLGTGPIDILFVGGFVSHLEHFWEEPRLVNFFLRLAQNARVILFDKRSMGLSERMGHIPTLDDTQSDMCVILDVVGSQRAVLFGISEGGPTCLLFAHNHAERVTALVLYGTLAKGSRSEDYPWSPPERLYQSWIKLMTERWGEPCGLEVFTPEFAKDEAFRDWWAKLLRLSASPGAVRDIVNVLRDLDVRDILPNIHVPTLLIHSADDRAIRVENARYMAAHMPNATYIELEKADHFWWLDVSDILVNEIEAYVANLDMPSQSQTILGTILAVNTASSELTAYIRPFKGDIVASSQQPPLSFIAFASPTRALECALRLMIYDPNGRIGVHTGEYRQQDDDYEGAVFTEAADLMMEAQPSEILISSTVKDLVNNMAIDFEFQRHVRAGTQQRIYQISS